MRVEIKHSYGLVEITVPEKNYLKYIREFLKKYGLESGSVREILKDGRKINIPWSDIYEGGMK